MEKKEKFGNSDWIKEEGQDYINAMWNGDNAYIVLKALDYKFFSDEFCSKIWAEAKLIALRDAHKLIDRGMKKQEVRDKIAKYFENIKNLIEEKINQKQLSEEIEGIVNDLHGILTPENLASSKKAEQRVIKDMVQKAEKKEGEFLSSETDENSIKGSKDPLETLKNVIKNDENGEHYYAQ